MSTLLHIGWLWMVMTIRQDYSFKLNRNVLMSWGYNSLSLQGTNNFSREKTMLWILTLVDFLLSWKMWKQLRLVAGGLLGKCTSTVWNDSLDYVVVGLWMFHFVAPQLLKQTFDRTLKQKKKIWFSFNYDSNGELIKKS